MALQTSPFGTYANVTGVVNATAAAEIVALFTELQTFLPSEPAAFAAGRGTPVEAGSEEAMPPPEFDDITLHAANKLNGEINAVKAAIAAAPTA